MSARPHRTNTFLDHLASDYSLGAAVSGTIAGVLAIVAAAVSEQVVQPLLAMAMGYALSTACVVLARSTGSLAVSDRRPSGLVAGLFLIAGLLCLAGLIVRYHDSAIDESVRHGKEHECDTNHAEQKTHVEGPPRRSAVLDLDLDFANSEDGLTRIIACEHNSTIRLPVGVACALVVPDSERPQRERQYAEHGTTHAMFRHDGDSYGRQGRGEPEQQSINPHSIAPICSAPVRLTQFATGSAS